MQNSSIEMSSMENGCNFWWITFLRQSTGCSGPVWCISVVIVCLLQLSWSRRWQTSREKRRLRRRFLVRPTKLCRRESVTMSWYWSNGKTCDRSCLLVHTFTMIQMTGLLGFWLIKHGFTSAPTQYTLYGRRFLQVWWPNQQCQSTEEGWLVIQTGLSLTRLTSPCYNTTTCMQILYKKII